MNIARYIYLSTCALIEVGLLVFGIMGIKTFWGDPHASVPIGMVLAETVCSVALIVITLVSFYRVKEKKDYPVLYGFLLKIPLLILTLGVMWFALDIPEAGWIAVVIAIPLAALILLGPRLKETTVSKKARQTATIPKFQADKAEWNWDDTVAEYLRLNGRPIDIDTEEGNRELAEYSANMSDSQVDQTYDYAGTPIAYFLAWLIKKELVSDAFLSAHSAEQLQPVREETGTPLYTLMSMDYVLMRDDVRQEAHRFMDLYYETEGRYGPFNRNTHKYFFDYYKVVCSGYEAPRYYCVDFDWNTYHKLAEVLDKRYEDFTGHAFYEDEMTADERRVKGRYFDRELELLYEPGTAADYVQMCADSFENMSESLSRDMAEHLLEFCQDELTDEEMQTANVLRKFEPSKLVVFKPEGSDPVPAYVILGGSEWEEEHGISFTVIDDFVMCCEYYSDAESPWTEDLQWKYKIRRDARRGNVCGANIIPSQFGGRNGPDNQITIPVAAAQCKEESDTLVEALFIMKLASHYDCRITYDGAAPNYMFVMAQKGELRTFEDSIPLR